MNQGTCLRCKCIHSRSAGSRIPADICPRDPPCGCCPADDNLSTDAANTPVTPARYHLSWKFQSVFAKFHWQPSLNSSVRRTPSPRVRSGVHQTILNTGCTRKVGPCWVVDKHMACPIHPFSRRELPSGSDSLTNTACLPNR
jgi:hypothetical protein